MARTARRTWQLREADAAELFGCKRQVLSGSSGREDATQSDSTHPRLFIECKLKAKQAVRTLWRATALLAAREHKIAVLVLYEKSKPGGLICVHEDDLDELVDERIRARELEK